MKETVSPSYEELVCKIHQLRNKLDNANREIEKLKASEKKYRRLSEYSSDGVFIHKKGIAIDANAASEAISGYNHDEISGKNLFKLFIPPEHHEKMLENIEKKSDSRYEFDIKRRDGKVVPIEMMVKNVIEGDEEFRVVTVRDITEQKQAENALRESEEKMRLIIENLPVVVWTTDQDGNTQFVSPNVEKVFGYTAEQIHENIQKIWYSRIHPDQTENVNSAFISLIEHNKPFNVEYQIKHRNGNWIWLHDIATTVREVEGKKYIYGVFHNITSKKKNELELEKYHNKLENMVIERTNELQTANEELKATNDELFDKNEELSALNKKLNLKQNEVIQLNEELIQTNEELHTTNESLISQKEQLETTLKQLTETQSQLIQAEKMASLGVLTAGIAHEINNPVNFISSGIQALKKYIIGISLIEKEYKKLNTENCAKRISRIKEIRIKMDLESYLVLAPKVMQGVIEGINRTVEIVKGLRLFTGADNAALRLIDIHENIDATLLLLKNRYKNRITITKKYGKLPPVNAYSGKLNQVFMNILSNAVDAILTKQQLSENEEIIIKTEIITNAVQISISDSGKGIPVEIVNRIFEPFFTTKEVGKGTGLGLAISHGIIEEHKGEISIENNPAYGATVKIVLPVK